ncbi:tetratricopeptide repeat protein [Labedaea rhizosphaerae]|uniref:Tetratricopeptide repeat protein n=1 Tax=Labedaea rhizosphaerae TaxID=598644 RepID=A0A4R6SN41_LABRH|nr:tetratricopeptide repeat protein [Labedaea rhizosphaerae]TDQ05936.1 tetratricopeptide repeat protein [Labedaea rhizosphaerae]
MNDDEFAKAGALYDLGRYDEAEERLRALLAVTPDDVGTLDVLALILLHGNRWSELAAIGAELMRVAPEYARGPMFRAIATANLGQVGPAVEFGRLAARLAPDDPIVIGQFAELLVAAELHEEAAAAIGRALELAPGQASLHRMHARALRAAHRLDDARAAAQEAVALDPMHPDSHLVLGDVLARQGKLADAEQEFVAALRQDPSAENLEAVVRTLADTGIPAQLEPLLARIAAAMGLSMPDDVAELRADVARVMRDAERYEEAFALASSVLRGGYHDLRAYSAALTSAWHLEKYEEGLALALDARARFPGTPPLLWLHSLFLLALSRLEECVAVARAYVALAPDAADGYTVLGRALLDLGRRDDALEAITEGLRLDPDDEQLREYLTEAKG